MIKNQVSCFLYAIWPKSKDLYPTYLKATLRTLTQFARLACIRVKVQKRFTVTKGISTFVTPLLGDKVKKLF